MQEQQGEGGHIQTRKLEIVVALFFAVVGAIVVYDSVRVGFKWASDGPQAGYFPFRIGLILMAGAAWVIVQTLRTWAKDGGRGVFAEDDAFRLVLKMLIPCIVYAGAVMTLGLYVSSIIFIAAFMIWQGKYAAWKAFATGIGVAVFLFMMFEVWFLVPLPKGPVEQLLGY